MLGATISASLTLSADFSALPADGTPERAAMDQYMQTYISDMLTVTRPVDIIGWRAGSTICDFGVAGMAAAAVNDGLAAGTADIYTTTHPFHPPERSMGGNIIGFEIVDPVTLGPWTPPTTTPPPPPTPPSPPTDQTCGPFSIEPTLGSAEMQPGILSSIPGSQVTVSCGAADEERVTDISTCACAPDCSWSPVCVTEEQEGFAAFAISYHTFMKETVVRNLAPEKEKVTITHNRPIFWEPFSDKRLRGRCSTRRRDGSGRMCFCS